MPENLTDQQIAAALALDSRSPPVRGDELRWNDVLGSRAILLRRNLFQWLGWTRQAGAPRWRLVAQEKRPFCEAVHIAGDRVSLLSSGRRAITLFPALGACAGNDEHGCFRCGWPEKDHGFTLSSLRA